MLFTDSMEIGSDFVIIFARNFMSCMTNLQIDFLNNLINMDAKFSPRSREIMFRSHEEAVRLGNSYIGLEHIFLGIIDGKDNNVTNILDELKLDIEVSPVTGSLLEYRLLHLQQRAKLRTHTGFPNLPHLPKPAVIVGDAMQLMKLM